MSDSLGHPIKELRPALKALAVRQVAQKNKGRKAAGPDGMANLTPHQMMGMAESLSISQRPSPVRRKLIDKPGKAEKRPLGIPNMCDRAQQALIVLALEPQWEARFSPRQYGFRRGRGAQDAIGFLQRHLRIAGPKWVLDADVEKFFDHLDHRELLERLDASPQITDAVRKILKAGALNLGEFTPSEQGTPQGGPLSPLLANIALSGLESHLQREFDRAYRGSIARLGRPAIAIYADDLVILHGDRSIVEWSRQCVQDYLAPLGLNLSEQKTRIVHTQDEVHPGTRAGFDFLGFHLQHGRRRGRGGVHCPYLLATPSPDAISRLYRNCVARIDRLTLSRKHRGARQAQQAQGRTDPVSVMIVDLNRMIRGWSAYFSRCNAKEAFSDVDHLLHQKLWTWAKRRFSRKRVEWIKLHLFGGIATDRDGMPLQRKDGALRESEWIFKSPFVSAEVDHYTLLRLAHTPIQRQFLVKPEKSCYDGDWPYWQNRMNLRYPGNPRHRDGRSSAKAEATMRRVRMSSPKG